MLGSQRPLGGPDRRISHWPDRRALWV